MNRVLFYDDGCAFCSGAVRLIARLDRRRKIGFAPLSGRLAARKGFAAAAGLEDGTLIVLREPDGRIFKRSDAVLELARALGGGWRLLALARLIPRRLRDGAYRWVARHRHLLAGTAGGCRLPGPEVLARLRE